MKTLVGILIGWWISNCVQAIKIFFDAKRTASEKLITHFSLMLGAASEWASLKVANRPDAHLRERFNQLVNESWIIIGQMLLYTPSNIATPFIKFNYELVELMNGVERGDERSRRILLQQSPEWESFRESQIFFKLTSLRRDLIRSIFCPWTLLLDK